MTFILWNSCNGINYIFINNGKLEAKDAILKKITLAQEALENHDNINDFVFNYDDVVRVKVDTDTETLISTKLNKMKQHQTNIELFKVKNDHILSSLLFPNFDYIF